MTLIRYSKGKNKSNLEPINATHENAPVFLIPGIFGYSDVMKELADKLYTKNSQTPIYYYHDSRLNNIDTLDDNIDAVAIPNPITTLLAEIKEVLPTNSPLKIAAYSYGCFLATEIAVLLKNQNSALVTNLYLIDGSPACIAEKFFEDKKTDKFIQNLTDIINYASCLQAQHDIDRFEATIITTDELEQLNIASLNQKKLALQIKTISDALLEKAAFDYPPKYFNFMIRLLTNDLTVLYDSVTNLEKITSLNIKALITEETAISQSAFNEWVETLAADHIETNEALIKSHHIDLLEGKNITLLADTIATFFQINAPAPEHNDEDEAVLDANTIAINFFKTIVLAKDWQPNLLADLTITAAKTCGADLSPEDFQKMASLLIEVAKIFISQPQKENCIQLKLDSKLNSNEQSKEKVVSFEAKEHQTITEIKKVGSFNAPNSLSHSGDHSSFFVPASQIDSRENLIKTTTDNQQLQLINTNIIPR